jgi:hypothetical protein
MSNALTRAAMLLLVAAFPARKQEEETTVDFTVQCQLTVFGKRLPECDITAALGILLIVAATFSLLATAQVTP